jgi:membrane protein
MVVWVYWSAQIFLLGAEFTWVYARRCGSLRGREDATTPRRRAEDPS